MLVLFPLACFVGTLLTDLAYWATADMMWADFSAWLLVFGIGTGVLVAITAFVDLLGTRHVRARRPAWLSFVGNVLALVVAIFNILVHSRDAWTSVVPGGLILSLLTVLIMAFATRQGWTTVYRESVGVMR
jgi:uncharacterized membrane protein